MYPRVDNTRDIGSSAARWDDVYASNGTIQTSDRNLKTNISGSDLGLNFVNSLKVGHGNNPWVPIWIFLPINILADSFSINLGQTTNILGFSVLLFIFYLQLNNYTTKIILLSSIIYIILGIVFGQPSGRFFYEPFLWFFIICLLKNNQ